MEENLRKIAVEIVYDTIENSGFSEKIMFSLFQKNSHLSKENKAYIRYLATGTLRNKIKIDYILDQVAHIPTKKMDPLLRTILETAVFELFYMSSPAYAIVNEMVEIVKEKGLKDMTGFANGVIRNVDRQKDKIAFPKEKDNKLYYLSVMTSHPMWLIKLWEESYGYEMTKEIAFGNLEIPTLSVAVNTLKTTKEELKNELLQEGLQVTSGDTPYSLQVSQTGDMAKLTSYNKGHFHVMDESAMEVVFLMDLQYNDILIDVCGAPGGKSFLASYLMENKGQIITRDIHEKKIELIKENICRLGIHNIQAEVFDGTITDKNMWGKADKVLIDAPCSGFGITRKKPEIKYRRTKKDLKELKKMQRQLLTAAAPLVKKDGILVYATCTLNKEENENMVLWFTSHYPYEIVEEKTIIPGKNDGFYIAKVRKKN